MSQKKSTSKPKIGTGGGHAARAGLVPIQLLVTPDEREMVRAAAALDDRTMAYFARQVVLERAKELVGDK